MLRNWINIHDLRRFREKIKRGEWHRLLQKLFSGARGKTRATWDQPRDAALHAWEIPALQRRWRRMVSGDPEIDHVEYVRRRFLAGMSGLVAFSPGCGSGGNELRWARTGLFRRIDACDLSPRRIAAARIAAEKTGLAGVVAFSVGDMRAVEGENAYDLVLAEGALHHFYPMRAALARLKKMLKPEGLLLVNDFVGPSRLQWTERQLRAAQSMLSAIPEEYRQRRADGKVKRTIDAPGRLRMLLADPSEAADSSVILPLLKEMFTPLEIKEKGGAIVNLVFFEIAHHFLEDNAKTDEILHECFALEDRLMRSGEISSDYILGVFQKPGPTA
ncbi:MAG: class I SAM-dependent methyltransferase [Candidatus Aminicenantes bacterium]|nr:class I SAM-dependent methyltransferase [Candidatus Aminicenantes bacterium]